MSRTPNSVYAAIILLWLPCTVARSAPLQKPCAGQVTIISDNLISTLKPDHPRLLMSETDWKRLDKEREKDPDLAKVVGRIEEDAKWLCTQPPLVYRTTENQLLDVSRQAVQRILLWGVAYHLSGDDAYAACAKRELLNLCWFPDWNPSHFLDTAEMTAAVAIGYDWFYDRLSPADRMIIMRSIVNKGIIPGINPGKGEISWQHAGNSWNPICFGGLTLGALAIADQEPELSNLFLNMAKNGVYQEDSGNWGDGIAYRVLMLSALQSALGTQWGLEKSPGLMTSPVDPHQLTESTGGKCDTAESEQPVDLQPALFWFARQRNDKGLLQSQRDPLSETLKLSVKNSKPGHENRLFALIALWWTGLPKDDVTPQLPLAWQEDGTKP